ncbi:MAG: lipoyl synthase [Marinilabiliales bacterium]|nr:MAG: lipoyl synthase [Marinilabiliales bacterium]
MSRERKPDWLKIKLPTGKRYADVMDIVKKHNLHTICQSGNCPNLGECWGEGTATFMILGDICTRSCRFCAVKTGKPLPPDEQEPGKVARSVKLMNLKHCVITSVDRDDLEDGGAVHWYNTIKKIKEVNPNTTIESLIPDFNGSKKLIEKVAKAEPEVISHNLETVERLSKEVRIKARYDISLKVLEILTNTNSRAKTGIMVGLGESNEEVIKTLKDIISTGCKVVTIGQYLQPTKNHLPVDRYVTPAEFEEFKKTGMQLGFSIVESAPLVRSSYHAEKHLSNK